MRLIENLMTVEEGNSRSILLPWSILGRKVSPLALPKVGARRSYRGHGHFFQIFGYWIMYFMFKIAEKSNPCIVRQIMRAFCPKPCLPNSQILGRHV